MKSVGSNPLIDTIALKLTVTYSGYTAAVDFKVFPSNCLGNSLKQPSLKTAKIDR